MEASAPAILLDTHIILDVLLKRSPFHEVADAIWKKCDDGEIHGWMSAVTATTIFYVARKILGNDKARAAIGTCLEAFDVAPVNRESLEVALRSTGHDFEDDVQIACAKAAGLDYIVTRDPVGFASSPVPAIDPRALLERLTAP